MKQRIAALVMFFGLLLAAPVSYAADENKPPKVFSSFDEMQVTLTGPWKTIMRNKKKDDTYPATDDHQSVHLDFSYPEVARDLNRWLPLVKWLLAIPHYIVLFFLDVAAFVMVVVAWFAILFTGRYPRSVFDFVEGGFESIIIRPEVFV